MTTHLASLRRRAAAAWLALLVAAAVAGAVPWLLMGSHGGRVHTARLTASGTLNSGCGNGNGGPGRPDCPTNPAKTFTMTATVSGRLAPGTAQTLTVRVSNPNSQPMQVTSVTPTVGAPTTAGADPRKPTCSPSWVATSGYTVGAGAAGYVAPARGYVDVPLPIRLVDLPATNQDNCKNATFPIILAAVAVQAP